MFCYDGVCGGRLPELARSSLVIVVLRKLPSREPTSCTSTISGVASREAVYTVRCEDAVYVLHAFQKKSKKGAATPKADMDLVEKRLKGLIREKERP